MLIKSNLLLALIMQFGLLFGQSKSAYVSHVFLDNKDEKWCWAFGQDNDNNMLIATATGIVLFDGINQNLIDIPYSPSAIAYDKKSGKTFVGGYEFFGELNYESYGQYKYKSLESYPGNDFKTIKIFNDTVWFISDSVIVRYSASNSSKIDKYSTADLILNMAVINEKVYFVIGYFLYTINNGKLVEVENDEFPVDEFAYSVTPNKDITVLGTSGRNIYLVSGKHFRLKELQNSSYFDNNIITDAALWSDSVMVLSSLGGGIALVNFYTGKLVNQVNYFNGLPDDEIRAMFIDNSKGIWVSHEYGISRIDFNVNIENYSFNPGIKGVPTCVKFFDNEIFVGTNDGLFELADVSNYNEMKVTVDVPVNVDVNVAEERKIKDDTKAEKATEEDKGSLFSFLSRKKKKESQVTGVEPGSKTETVYTKQTVTKTEKQIITKRSLKSINHVFQPVKGFNDKCRKMVEFKGSLLIAGNNGLYALKYGNIEKLISAYVNDIYFPESENQAYCATRNGVYRIGKNASGWDVVHYSKTTDVPINSIVRENNDTWVLTLENQVIRCKLEERSFTVVNQVQLPQPAGMTFFTKKLNDTTFIFTSKIIYCYDQQGNLKKLRELPKGSIVLNTQTDYTWIYENFTWKNFDQTNEKGMHLSAIKRLQLFPELKYIDVNKNGEIWIVDEKNNIVRIGKNTNLKEESISINILSMNSAGKQIETDKNIKLAAHRNNLKITMSSPFYLKQGGVFYSHFVEGMDENWSEWNTNSTLDLAYIAPGSHNLKYKVKSATGEESQAEALIIKVAKPFTQSILFFILLAGLLSAGVYFVLRLRMRQLQKDKEILEQKVQERTQTISEQKTRIEKQHDEITQSIRYAKRIQTAMLPYDEIIEAVFPNHFILFKPRDIVSGDFYFFKPVREHLIVFAAADCTGHGVPGGFMSMLGISFLNEITSQVKNPTAAEILNHLREKVKITLGQNDPSTAQKDGMDIALCLIDIDNKTIQYAGAFNPLYLIRNNELQMVEADRQPVAVYFKEVEFENNVIEVQKGDHFYIFSDGYYDQIGGPNQRKFMSKNFKQLLLDVHNKPFDKQKELLDKNIEDWKDGGMQMDDILVIGFCLD
jgi:serine phosphatase RsbU (regulator of sigma subunit)